MLPGADSERRSEMNKVANVQLVLVRSSSPHCVSDRGDQSALLMSSGQTLIGIYLHACEPRPATRDDVLRQQTPSRKHMPPILYSLHPTFSDVSCMKNLPLFRPVWAPGWFYGVRGLPTKVGLCTFVLPEKPRYRRLGHAGYTAFK